MRRNAGFPFREIGFTTSKIIIEVDQNSGAALARALYGGQRFIVSGDEKVTVIAIFLFGFVLKQSQILSMSIGSAGAVRHRGFDQ